ncbi:MAG: hypothetical protein GXX98_13520 [Planctomycetes bacterium]|nr:hypothetical protein [Planctomycetota bacterium]
MNATKLIILASVVGILIAIGTLLGRWARAQSQAAEARYSQAMTVLAGK